LNHHLYVLIKTFLNYLILHIAFANNLLVGILFLIIEHFDYFQRQKKKEEETEDGVMLESAWKAFLDGIMKQKKIKKIYLWTDRGRKDFMNQEVLLMFKNIAAYYDITIVYSTFESKHGHSICDGHFGTGKKKVRKDINLQSGSKEWTIQFVMDCFAKTKNTTTFFFEKCPKSVFPKVEFNLPKGMAISDCKCFVFTKDDFKFFNFTQIEL